MWNRFSEPALRVFLLAQNEAERFRIKRLGTEELLLGLLAERNGLAVQILLDSGITVEDVRKGTEELLDYAHHAQAEPMAVMSMVNRVLGSFVEFDTSPQLQRVLNHSVALAGENLVQTDDLLLGLLAERNCIGVRVLEALGISIDELRQKIIEAKKRNDRGLGPML